MIRPLLPTLLLLSLASPPAQARQWIFPGVADPVDADFVAENNGYVVLTGENGASFELPLANFSKPDQAYIRLLSAPPEQRTAFAGPGKPVSRARDYKVREEETITGELVTLGPSSELRLGGTGDVLRGSSVRFTASDGWLLFERIPPSEVSASFLDRMLVGHAPADPGRNVRVVAHAGGTLVIPHPPDFAALTLFEGPGLSGKSLSLGCQEKHGEEQLGELGTRPGSLVLRRGYMATLAENADGTGASRNYVAQDHDVVLGEMPKELANGVRFVRVFPWRWTSKKGIAGGIHQNLGVGWFYNWNISDRSSAGLEYVPIKQKRWWPGLDHDWQALGATHLLGYNEPDRPDQANMSVDEALAGWPELLRTGLRLGSPAPSDGGLGWLYEFMDKADRQGLRVDFVAVHYYRGHGNPGDAKGAANQMKAFLQRVHDRTRRPLWVTEWNNGANWSQEPDPNERQQRDAIREMIEMLDETPFVERYALYNWVEPVRELVRKDGSLTPAGQVYRDQRSPVFFRQPK